MSARTGWEDWGKLLLRLAVGGLLIFHGIAKLKNGIGWMAGPLSGLGLPAFVGYGVYVGEVIAPIFLILGKWARIAGVIVAFNMAGAIIIALRDKMFTLNMGGGWAIELELMFLLGGLVIFLLGSGKYSISKGNGAWD
jgi:putative oxidoreductase